MGETPEVDRLLQLRLRAGEPEVDRGVSGDFIAQTDPEAWRVEAAPIIAGRIKSGCPNCKRPWSQSDIDSDFPAIGVSCERCWKGV